MGSRAMVSRFLVTVTEEKWNHEWSLRVALNALPAALQNNNGSFAFLFSKPRPRSARTEPRTRARFTIIGKTL